MPLTPPLRFRIRRGVLRVRIAPGHPGASPSALEPDNPLRLLQALAHIVFGGLRPSEQPERPSTSDATTHRMRWGDSACLR